MKHLKICLYGDYLQKWIGQPCKILANAAHFWVISFADFIANTLEISTFAKKQDFVKTTIFISTHGDENDFEIDWQEKISTPDFFSKIKSIITKNSKLIIFDSSCHSFSHFDTVKNQKYFSNLKTMIYVGGSCPNSIHESNINLQEYLLYEPLMEPILQNFEYEFSMSNQDFESFAKSILSVKTFSDLETKIKPLMCTTEHDEGCMHLKTSIIQEKEDESINEWFEFPEAKISKFFLQFLGYKFEYLDVTSWGYEIFFKTEDKAKFLSEIYKPTSTRKIPFELLDITTDWSSTEYLTIPGFSFHKTEVVTTSGEFPKKEYYFTAKINKTTREKLKVTHLFRLPLPVHYK